MSARPLSPMRRTSGEAGLAAASGRPAEQIEFRVAASVAQLGIAARLICPAFGSAVLDAEISIDVAYARWVPALGGPFRLSLPETAFPAQAGHGRSADLRTARGPLLRLLGGPIGSLVAMTAAMAVSRRILWGNVASAINSAAVEQAKRWLCVAGCGLVSVPVGSWDCSPALLSNGWVCSHLAAVPVQFGGSARCGRWEG